MSECTTGGTEKSTNTFINSKSVAPQRQFTLHLQRETLQHHQDFSTKVYVKQQAQSLSADNLPITLFEFEQLTAAATTSTSRSQIQIEFLSQLFLAFSTQQDLKAQDLKPKHTAIQRVLAQIAHQHDFTTVICTSLEKSVLKDHQKQEERDRRVSFILKAFLNTKNDSFQSVPALVISAAVCSGSVLSTNTQSYKLATAFLLSVLRNDSVDLLLTSPLRQAILFAFLSSEAIIQNQKIYQPIINKLPAMSSNENDSRGNLSTSTIGMAEQLSPSSQNLGNGIINVLVDLGPSCMSSVSTLRETLYEITKTLPSDLDKTTKPAALDEEAVARLIYFFSERGSYKNNDENSKGASSSSALVGTLTNDYDISDRTNNGGSQWNLAVVSEILSQDYGNLDWGVIARKFDFSGFFIRDALHFSLLLNLYQAAARTTFPFDAMVSKWQNRYEQLSLIKISLSVSPSVFSFPASEEEAADAATAGENTSPNCQNPRGWASSRLLQVLLEMSENTADRRLVRGVSDLFVKGLLSFPEILICSHFRRFQAVSQGLQPNVGAKMQGELTGQLLQLFFKPNRENPVRNGPAAIRRLWEIDYNTVVAASIEAWRSTANESQQSRVFTIIHIITIIRHLPSPQKSTPIFISGNKNNEFSISIAFVMADNDLLKLRAWLNSRIPVNNDGFAFVVALVDYLGKYHASALPRVTATNNNNGKGASLVSIENLMLTVQVLRVLDASMLAQEISTGNTNNTSSQTLGDRIKILTEACVAVHPNLSSAFVQQPQGDQPGNSSTQQSRESGDEIEEMANSYFQKIYTSEQSIDEVVNMLKRFKVSGTQKENDIFACMIHNLFDEYRFFSKYPEKELRITGILFGKLIQHQLVSSITLGIALRYVLEALRKPPGPLTETTSNSGKMFRFGMFALEQFKERLHEWPQYCSHIVQIPHLKEGYATLVQEIEGAMVETQNKSSAGSIGSATNDSNSVLSEKKQSNEGVPSTVSLLRVTDVGGNVVTANNPEAKTADIINAPPRVAKFGPKLGRAVNIIEEDVQHEPPPDSVLDKVQFLINNVTMSNVDSKAASLKDLLQPKYFGWLGNYLVVKRISTQPNFHSVYLAFLEQLGDYGRGLVEAILSSVYLNIGKLLRSPKITTSSSERSLLKNLGSWLGQITLARSKPILQITLDCKELLYQGYENGMLIAVTPFVAKILEGAKKSVVFRPPNPWVMGLLSVFRALYGVDDLKMNIKFEVDVLCKNLSVQFEDIPMRADDLAKRIAPVKTRNPDFNIKSIVSSQSPGPNNSSSNSVGQGGDGKPNIQPTSMSLSTPALQVGSPLTSNGSNDQQQTVIPNLASYVTINPNLNHFFQQLATSGDTSNINNATLKRNVPIAVDRAIREIIQPVVERSVTIACITTKEIVVKDFAMESDENKMRKAAQLMVANLAGSLALVTCREPLRASVSTHLRQLLVNSASANSSESTNVQLSDEVQSVIDQCVNTCSNDNLDLGCMLIEKAATEKAVRDMDEAIAPSLQTRKKHREQTGQPFYDMSIFNSTNQRYPAALPESLRPKPVGLRSEQLHVYEAFQRIPRQPNVPAQQQGGASNAISPASDAAGSMGNKDAAKFNVESFTRIAMKLENVITTLLTAAGSRAPEITLSILPADHEVKQLLFASKQMTTSVPAAGQLAAPEQDSVLQFAQNIFKRLYELRLSEPLRLEAFVGLLDSLNGCCRQLSKDIGTWATYAPTETDGQRKLHRTVLLLLLRSNLLQVTELDIYLCERVDSGRNIVWLEFTMAFIRTALHEKIVNPNDLPHVLNVLNKLSIGNAHSHQISQLLSFIQEVSGLSSKADKGRSTPDNVAVTVSGLNALVGKPDKPTHQESSSMSSASLNNLAGATKRALDSIELISRKDPENLVQHVTLLLDGWMRLNSDGTGQNKTMQFIQLLQQNGIGKDEEQTERFFRVSTEILVRNVLKNASVEESKSQALKQLNYLFIDEYGKLVSVLMRHLNSGGSSEQIASQRISLLNQILGVTMRTMMADYERSKRERVRWDQRPWFRLLLNLVMNLNSPSSTLDPISYGILSVFGSAFHVVQPLVIPGFAFAWLELISHRMFLSNLLLVKGQKGWALAHQLLIDIFLFLEPHLRKTELTDSIRHLYKGTLRVLLVLLHDFPAFLSGYHLSFCNVIPENCVQMRNIVLSAISRGMTLPDPFTPDLKVDKLPEVNKSPVILSNVVGPLSSIREGLDSFLKTRQPADFVQTLLSFLCKNGINELDSARVNSLVLYVGMHAIAKMQNSQVAPSFAHTAEMEIILRLMDLNDSGRYTCLNAIANQLRYPSSHTNYFSHVMLFLFSEAKDESVREQVTRVLLERLIVHRPHPWGLLVTFIELIKNQRYQFWTHPFTRCATEIENLFERVAKTCMTPGTKLSALGVE